MIKKITIGLVLLAGLASSGSAFASEEELREAYAAYQEAAAQDDLHAALPHAQAAYELALELYGPADAATGSAALDYARVLTRVVEWEQAIDVLSAATPIFRAEGDTNLTQLFEALYLRGRAQRHFHGQEEEFDHGDQALEEALVLGRQLYGESSEEVGLVYLEIGRPNSRDVEPMVANRRAGIVMRSGFIPEDIRHDALDRALDIFEATPDRRLEVAQIRAIQGLNLMILDRKYAAYDVLQPTIRTLRGAGYADDTMVSIFLTMLRMRTASYAEPRQERAMEEGLEYASLRTDGMLHVLFRPNMNNYGNLARRYDGGQVSFSYDVDQYGHPQNILVTEADLEEEFDDVLLEIVSGFRYLPRVVNGQGVTTEGVTYTIHFGPGRNAVAYGNVSQGPSHPPIGGDLTGPVPR